MAYGNSTAYMNGRSQPAEQVVWAAVKKESAGEKPAELRRGSRNETEAEGAAPPPRTREERSEAAKRGWETRRSKDAYA